jgi:outer membrane protein assembly factor BamB
VYAAGFQEGTGSYTYGTGVTAMAIFSTTNISNVVLVKYNSSGTALWARTVSAGSGASYFNAVAVDSSGNVYAAGYQWGTGSYTYGTGVTAKGTYSVGNVVLVKYNSSGTAQWARTVSAGSGYSHFKAVAVDSSGVYAAGYQEGTGSYTYGTGVTAKGTSSSNNVVLVKYNSSGTAQWAQTVSAGGSFSEFNAVAVDSSGNVYAAGSQNGRGSYTYGTGVTAQGTYSNDNVVLVKYNSSGDAQWAQTVSAGSSSSYFYAVVVDSSGNVYAAGSQNGSGSYTYGTGVTAKGTSTSNNVVLVRYNSSGAALWAKTVSAGSSYSYFYAVAVDNSGVYAAGYQRGTGSYTYGTGVTAQGRSVGENVVLVKYRN